MKLSHSRMPFVRVYFRETQELVFDAHDKAFRFYGGVCRRGIYDNMKTAVEAIFVGKARRYNLRFLQMCSHHLIEPVACTPASGWEKGQVENQVGNLRDQMFRPKPRVSAISKDAFDEREQSSRSTQQVESPITVLNISGMNDDVQQEAQCVDQDVPLSTFDLLARVVARRIEQRPPFCAPFAVCELMMAAVGLGSRPSCSRTATYSS